tara:strand:+ start:410 stop:1894 length:1485 start_codon:yes stop_codon:yes gene_type:complete
MADKKLNIKVSTTGAGKAKQKVGGLNGAISKMGKAVGIASAAYFGARGLISGFSSVIRLAGIQEQAEKKLEVALGKTSKSLLDHASALQKVTTFGDEAIIGVQASLAAFIDNEEQIKKATEATLDMAVAMGMDLKAAGDLVAKTLGSSTNAMSRYGIEVNGAVGSTERLESLTNNVATLFGGQASAQAETMAGSLDQASNSAGDLAEKIGEKLSPLVVAMASDFKRTAENLSELISPTVISDQDTFNELIRERNLLSDSFTETLSETNEKLSEETLFVGDLWNEWVEVGEISKDAIDLGTVALDEQIQKFNDLLFVKGEALKLTSAEMDMEMEYVKVIDVTRGAIQNKYAEEMKGAALSGQSAIEAMKSVVRAETMEAVAGYLASVLKSVPFPANLIFAAAGGGVVAGLMDKALGAVPNKFATGADFITSGPTPMLVGESGAERVSVTPLQGPNINGPQGGITLNIQGNMIGNESFVRDVLIPEISNAKRMNLA